MTIPNLKFSRLVTTFEVKEGFELRSQKIGYEIPLLHYYFLLHNGKVIDTLSTGREYCAKSINAWLFRNEALNTDVYYSKGQNRGS